MSRLKPTISEIFFTDPGSRDAATQEEFERNFYSRLKLPNGIYKTTHARRFDDLNELISAFLPTGRRVELLDVGISSGISTLEWLESLEGRGVDAHIVAGDLDIEGYVISLGRSVQILIDKTGYVLQIDVGSRSITSHYRFPLWRRLLFAAPVLALNTAVRLLWLSSSALRDHVARGEELLTRGGMRCQRLSLFSPRLHPTPRLTLIEDDIVANHSRFPEAFDAIRAANVMNFYLDPGMLRQMLDTLRSRLRSGGLLAICRTDEHAHNLGTLFRLRADRSFEVVRRIGTGSEIEDFVLSGGDPARLNRR